MTHKSVYNPKTGVCDRVLRDDALRDPRTGRYYVPTSEATKWVGDWEEFQAAGGTMCFNGDQTEIELLLPESYKFSIGFQQCDYPRCKCIVRTSTQQPEPVCPRGLRRVNQPETTTKGPAK